MVRINGKMEILIINGKMVKYGKIIIASVVRNNGRMEIVINFSNFQR